MRVKNIFSTLPLLAALALANSSTLQDTCDSYCYRVVSPVLERTAILQKQVEAHNVIQESDIKTRLESIERQLMQALESKTKLKDPPNGFKKIGSKFYYIEDNEMMNWFAAAHRCHVLGGHLVSLQSKQEYDDLKAQLITSRSYWIDINDLSREGQFLSLTTGHAPIYSNYERGNPDNYKGNEHCGGLWNYRNNLLMNDFECHSHLYFVCESFTE